MENESMKKISKFTIEYPDQEKEEALIYIPIGQVDMLSDELSWQELPPLVIETEEN